MKWIALTLFLVSCSRPAPKILPNFEPCQTVMNNFSWADPTEQNVNTQKLIELTRWVKTSKAPIFSILLSKNGKIIYELYTSQLDRNSAHYLMSVTKSFTSALMGVALDRHFITSTEDTVTNELPENLFPDEAARMRFTKVTLKDVLGMSALDAQVAPHLNTSEAKQRLSDFFTASNRTQFALTQSILPEPGKDFQYTDITPAIAAGVIEYKTKLSLMDLANQSLFEPMGFQNQEWMHEDRAGIDNGAYGLRLRPIDMQKFGLLYLNQGCWEGKQLLSKKWTSDSFKPWIKSKPAMKDNDYGWYWWHYFWGNGWTAHIAAGWKGQRIAVFPQKNVVITMTALDEDDTEDKLFGDVFRYVSAAVDTGGEANPSEAELKQAIQDVLKENRVPRSAEYRMIPSVEPKETHHQF